MSERENVIAQTNCSEGSLSSVDQINNVLRALITKGGLDGYQPWGHAKVQGLLQRLPERPNGAGSWIVSLQYIEERKIGRRVT